MPLRRSRTAREAIARLPHPQAGVLWFEALPDERREELERSYRASLMREDFLVRRSRRRLGRDVTQMALVFLAADQLLAPHATLASALALLAGGAALGAACFRLNADRVLSGALGALAFFVLQWLTRGGLTALHMFTFMPVGAACVYLGWRREEREYDA